MFVIMSTDNIRICENEQRQFLDSTLLENRSAPSAFRKFICPDTVLTSLWQVEAHIHLNLYGWFYEALVTFFLIEIDFKTVLFSRFRKERLDYWNGGCADAIYCNRAVW